jgi:HPt (histidine-containing phosphotransfer) domain-containing protein
MEGRALKFGWLLLSLWLICIGLLASSYRSTNETKEQIYELGSGIQELRETLTFDSPYRSHMADTQALNIQLIYALRLQIDTHYKKSWFLPDIHQLLFTTDRFIEQTQIYLDNNLDLLNLVEQIRAMRNDYKGQQGVSELYLRLSANVLDAMYSDNGSSPAIYRELDQVYFLSTKLPSQQRQDLQQVLAQISTVLGGYAQGQYIVDKLITHDVHAQIALQRNEFNQLLTRHIWLGIFVSFLTMAGYLWLIRIAAGSAATNSAELSSRESQDTEASDSINEQPNLPVADSPVEAELGEPEIDFAKMLDSLNQDVESVCMLLEVFIEDHTGDVERITSLLTDSPEDAQRKAHSLKGVGGNLGASKLRESASKVEVAIQEDITAVPDLLDELKGRLDNALEEARIFLKENAKVES